ncbi:MULTISPECIES: hypothetical protein [unclassified Campylobacter]|uniref:hypothetical protein n=1 Tax=unclassified Campylobacter TaxID=2593542 RepID=UPI003D358D02
MQRNRSQGWTHAKLSGHKNEENIKNLLQENIQFQYDFLSKIDKKDAKIVQIQIGGLHESQVSGVLDKPTKSKTDLKIKFLSGENVKISIKKSLSGQVYFVGAENFISIFEKHFYKISNEVKRSIRLFWAAAEDAKQIISEFADKSNVKIYNSQIKHKSLNANTLKNYNENLYIGLLSWFKQNLEQITKLSFSMGAASDESEWSDFIWYINTLGENSVNEIFDIQKLSLDVKNLQNQVFYGNTNGGTTIQLPFGFVQWHQAKMQFHHNFDKIKKITS